ncbi:MAG TPA: septation protein SepH [Nocardioidaceae bacterium]|nr:septation protein SepH [Nocardioidaceae bacterium]
MKEQDLTLVGLTEDKQKLVLVNQAGEEFTLPADARLRAALRGEHARLGQLEITMESALRPRDIQARIRAGESPEAVAAAAQTTLEKVMGYATPVLAERAHVADRALRASVRRKNSEGPARILWDAVAERLRGRNVDPESVAWDAWRREDGRWTVVADYRSGESARHAEFVFDAPGRYVVAEDDEARWLVGEQTSARGPQPRTATGPRRLSAVGADEELPLGEDAIGMVNEAPADEATEDLSATAAAVRATGDADWIATQASERPAPVELGSESDPEVAEPEDATEVADEAAEEEPAAEPEAPRRSSKKGRRASVPSWDEIMFGGGKRE